MLGENPNLLFLEALRGLKSHLQADRLILIHRSQQRYFETCGDQIATTQDLAMSPLSWSTTMLPLQKTDHPAFGVHYGNHFNPELAKDYQRLAIASTAILKADEHLGLELWAQSQDKERIWSKRDQRQMEAFWPCLKLLIPSQHAEISAITTGD